MNKRDYYEVLGVNKNASDSELKRAYRLLARKYHPDVNREPDAEGMFKELSEAYEVLSNPQQRALYDQFGHAGIKPDLNTGFSGFTDFDFGLDSILDAFFGTGGRRRRGDSRKATAERGADLRINLEISFVDAIFGVEKELTINHLEACLKCNGKGAEPDSKIITCSTCHGTGQVQQVQRSIFSTFTQIFECPDCRGEGMFPQNACKECNGGGRIKNTKQLKVKIPAGVDTGARLRITNEGDAGIRGGQAGDLYVVIYTMADPENIFDRQDTEIYCKVAIDYTQAVLGDEINIPTLEGQTKIQISAGTQPGTIIRLKGKGVPFMNNPQRRGDLHLEINLNIPTNICAEEVKLLKEIQTIRKKEKETHDGGFMNILRNALGAKS